jgi:hypothetical protein
MRRSAPSKVTAATSSPIGPRSVASSSGKHVTLAMLWDEYIERQPDGYRYSEHSRGAPRSSHRNEAGQRHDRATTLGLLQNFWILLNNSIGVVFKASGIIFGQNLFRKLLK